MFGSGGLKAKDSPAVRFEHRTFGPNGFSIRNEEMRLCFYANSPILSPLRNIHFNSAKAFTSGSACPLSLRGARPKSLPVPHSAMMPDAVPLGVDLMTQLPAAAEPAAETEAALTEADIRTCVRVLRAIEADRSHLNQLTQEQRQRAVDVRRAHRQASRGT